MGSMVAGGRDEGATGPYGRSAHRRGQTPAGSELADDKHGGAESRRPDARRHECRAIRQTSGRGSDRSATSRRGGGESG